MKKSDVFVMPSAPETFGLVYLEAMASGCIVVGAKGWGIDGLIKNGFDGYLVEPRDIDALKNFLLTCLLKIRLKYEKIVEILLENLLLMKHRKIMQTLSK